MNSVYGFWGRLLALCAILLGACGGDDTELIGDGCEAFNACPDFRFDGGGGGDERRADP